MNKFGNLDNLQRAKIIQTNRRQSPLRLMSQCVGLINKLVV